MADVPSLFFRADRTMPMSSAGYGDPRLAAGGFEQNRNVDPDLFVQKHSCPDEGRSLAGFPVIFQKIPC
jgi:hypothetical protein